MIQERLVIVGIQDVATGIISYNLTKGIVGEDGKTRVNVAAIESVHATLRQRVGPEKYRLQRLMFNR